MPILASSNQGISFDQVCFLVTIILTKYPEYRYIYIEQKYLERGMSYVQYRSQLKCLFSLKKFLLLYTNFLKGSG